ncbi:MAG: hypothetical protein ACK4ZN_08835 [Oceanibaculum sp.]
MGEASRNSAALDLACLMQVLLRKPSRCSAEERKQIRIRHLRALAALNGHELPEAPAIDADTARAAYEAVCKALVLNGVDNTDIAAWFNDSSWQRQQQVAR